MARISESLSGQLGAEALDRLEKVLEKRNFYTDGVETVTSGAIALDVALTKVSVTGTVAYTLADGTMLGQRKDLRCTVAATVPDGTVTPTTFADGSTITLDAVDEQVELEWNTDGWHVVSITGATVNA